MGAAAASCNGGYGCESCGQTCGVAGAGDCPLSEKDDGDNKPGAVKLAPAVMVIGAAEFPIEKVYVNPVIGKLTGEAVATKGSYVDDALMIAPGVKMLPSDVEEGPKIGTVASVMDEATTLDRVPWCFYCICCGCGCTKRPSRLVSLMKCCIYHQKCISVQCVDPLDGCCGCVDSCCCCRCLFQLPPRGGTSRCVCCNTHCCGHFPARGGTDALPDEMVSRRSCGSDDGSKLTMYDSILYESFIPCYSLCCGIGVASMGCECFRKCGCCRCSHQLGSPCGDGCCTCQNACMWIHCQMRLPPKFAHNPIIACCGCRLKKSAGYMATAPRQQEMS